jgi:hypothetical protein
VGVLDDFAHEQLRIDDAVLVWQHAPSDREDGPKDTDVEQDGPTGRDLEMQERVGIDERKEDQDGGERAGKEGDKAGKQDCLGFRIVVDVLVGERVRLGESLLEVMRQFVELAKLPTCEGRELARADRGGILVILLGRTREIRSYVS